MLSTILAIISLAILHNNTFLYVSLGALVFSVITIISVKKVSNKKFYDYEKIILNYCKKLTIKYNEMLFNVFNLQNVEEIKNYTSEQENNKEELVSFTQEVLDRKKDYKEIFYNYTKIYAPEVVIHNRLLLSEVIDAMENGKASDYKQAIAYADKEISREEQASIQRRYLSEKAMLDQKQRDAMLESQRKIEEYASEQADAAKRAAQAQERAEKYAKRSAESIGKLEQIEKEREAREKEEYIRNKY